MSEPKNEPKMLHPFKDLCSEIRSGILQEAEAVRLLLTDLVFEDIELRGRHPESDSGEMRSNIVLAFRHLEDARMRIGKAIQAFDGGTSVHDR